MGDLQSDYEYNLLVDKTIKSANLNTTSTKLIPYIALDIKCDDDELMPERFHDTDAGLDLKAASDYSLYIGERVLIKTGVSVKIPPGCVGLLFPRSSLSKKGILMTNSVGVIDSDYRGEILASVQFVRNHNDHLTMGYQKIDKYERIVQLVVVPVLLTRPDRWKGTDKGWFDTARGEGGFGSTGK